MNTGSVNILRKVNVMVFFVLIVDASYCLGNISRTSTSVILIDNGNTVTLSNGIVEGTIQKNNAKMISMNKGSKDNLIGNAWYWDCNADTTASGQYQQVSNAVYSLVSSSNDQVEVSFKHSGMQDGNLNYDVHYVLRRGDSGFYAFAILSSIDRPAWTLVQARCVVRNNPSLFHYMVVDDQRQKVPPTPAELAAARASGGILSPKEATRLPDGSVNDKYLYSNYVGEHHVHGWAGTNYGMWMIIPSNEFQNGGPTSQELTVHQTETTPVILETYQGAHYGSGVLNFTDNETWEKIYGPFFVYVNEGATEAEQWADAKAKAKFEKDHWPYQWMNHRLYPIERGTVGGVLNITDGTSPDNAWVILSQPEIPGVFPNWQSQCKNYQFYARADANGVFEIEDVRQGIYSLYSFVDDIPEEYCESRVQVLANEITDLGSINWQPAKHGRKVWQIGTFDRTAGEYKHGEKFHDGHSWGMWLDYPTDFPNDVSFIIGMSNERHDWNYTQMAVDLGNGQYHLPVWNVHFDLDVIPKGQATLSVGIAASRNGALEVKVNGVQVEYDTNITAGSACVRNSIQGTYQLKLITFNTSLLREGTNTISFKQFRGRVFANIMYDAIRLELPF